MAKSGLPADVMDRIRKFPFLETTEEVTSFVEFCENSSYKIVRGMPDRIPKLMTTDFNLKI